MARLDDRRDNVFLLLWTLAVLASTAAFLFYLVVRVKAVELGYELGQSHQKLARLREVERVLSLELGAHRTPERVDLIARALFGMQEPAPERVRPLGKDPAEPRGEEPVGVAKGPGP